MDKKAVYKIDNLRLDHDNLMLNETIFNNANGYIGVRSCFEEAYETDTIRGSYINGFYDIKGMKQAEKLFGLPEEKQVILNVVDSQTILLKLDNEEFSMFEGTVLESSRWLHMEEGYTARRVVWRSPQGKELEIIVKRMASFSQLSLFTIEYCLNSLNFAGDVTFVSSHIGDVINYSNPDDPRVAAKSLRHLLPVSAELVNNSSYLTSRTSGSGLTVCTGVRNVLSAQSQVIGMDHRIDGHRVVCTLNTIIGKGETVKLVKYTVFSDSIRHRDCRSNAEAEMNKALSRPLNAFYEDQKAYLKDYWEHSLLEIQGDDDLNQAVRYNLYQLIQSVGKDKYCNIAAKGLSGEGYEGHYFWDTEMYIQPFFTLTNPEISKSLIEYRYSILDRARENARILGHKKGVLYPWRTIMGKECSGYFPSGSAQYHINGDITYAIVDYYLATKDFVLIVEKGAEIVFETARLWIDTGNFHEGLFYINEVTGPDEYTCMVNNNYYTNASAQYNLHWAVLFYKMLEDAGTKAAGVIKKIGLTPEEIHVFEQAEKNMYLPYDKELGINPQDDSFLTKKRWDIENTPKDHFPLLLHYHPLYLYRHQVCKQADTVLAHFIFEDAQSTQTIRNSFHYYEKVTTHDSSLSTCIFSIVASKLGLEDKAYLYFGDSAKLDLFNTHRNTKDGIHTANMGGTYMAIVYGFGGLRLKESGIYFSPILPKAWVGYSFKILYEGSRIQAQIEEKGCIFTLVSGEAKVIHVYGKAYLLEDQVAVARTSVDEYS